MCDYSLMAVPNRLAREGEELITQRFRGTPAVTAALVFAIFQTIVLALAAAAWGRLSHD